MVRQTLTGRKGQADPVANEAMEHEQVLALMLAVLTVEQDELLTARSLGQYSSRTIARVQGALDLRQAQLQQIGTASNA